jgi:hypothetical protein
LLVASASKFEITDSKGQGKLARNLTSALSRLFLRLAESGTNGDIDQTLIQSNLKPILQQAWYETHNGVLDLDMTTGQEP